MNPFSDLKYIKKMKEQFGVKADKNFGQNFLINDNILKEIAEAAYIGENDGIIEVGPGLGALTYELAETGASVLAIELDKRLLPVLETNFLDFENVKFLQGDILKEDIKKLIRENLADCENINLVANLPYYITTPIIMKFLEEDCGVSNMVVMVQKEVADRICASPGGKDYGILTIAVNYRCEAEIVTLVPPEYFSPAPKVTSAVIRLKVREKKAVSVQNEKMFFRVVEAAFGQRRKTLANSLSGSSKIEITKYRTIEILKELGIREDARAEQLTLLQFAQISDILSV